MKPLLDTPNPDAMNEVFVRDTNDGKSVSITPADGVYKVICYDVSNTDPNIPTLKDEKQFDTMEEALTFAETWLA